MAIGIIITLSVLLLMLSGLLALYVVLKYHIYMDQQKPVNFSIAPQSAVAIDIADDSHKISTIWNQYITVSINNDDLKELKYSGVIAVGIHSRAADCTWYKLLDEKINTHNNTPLVRYWTTKTHPNGSIHCTQDSDTEDTIEVYWSSIGSNDYHNVTYYNCSVGVNVSNLYEKVMNDANDNELVTVKFIMKLTNKEVMQINVSLEECLPTPDIDYRDITIDDNTHIFHEKLQLQSLFQELSGHSVLFINTRGISSEDHFYDVIQVELTPNNSRDESMLLYIGISGFIILLSLLIVVVIVMCVVRHVQIRPIV